VSPVPLDLVLTPHGSLILIEESDSPALDAPLVCRLQRSFNRGPGHGLLQLGAEEAATALPPVFSYWRDFGARYVTAVCTHPEMESPRGRLGVSQPANDELERIALSAPPMVGAEYLTATVLSMLWRELDQAFFVELAESHCAVQDFQRRNPAWNLVGRVHFNLAENRRDAEAPFAFLATYTTRLSAHAKAQHLPLGQALREYAGAANKARLLSLLLPVQRASESCPWLKEMVDQGEIFHPLRWTPAEAMRLLRDVPQLARVRSIHWSNCSRDAFPRASWNGSVDKIPACFHRPKRSTFHAIAPIGRRCANTWQPSSMVSALA
jgi:hypothetical protein